MKSYNEELRNELRRVDEKLSLDKSGLENENHLMAAAIEELERIEEKLAFRKCELEHQNHLLKIANEEVWIINEKVGLSRNELRVNENLLKILKNEIKSAKDELENAKNEFDKEKNLPILLKKELKSIKSELELIKIELKETNDELYSANDQLLRRNEEIDNSKLLLSSLNNELLPTPSNSKMKENHFNDKRHTLYNDEESTSDNPYSLFNNEERVIEKVHSLFSDKESAIENSQTRNIVDKPVMSKSQNDNNSIKLPGINIMQFHFRDKYENESSQINEANIRSGNIEGGPSQLKSENNLYKFMLSEESNNSSEFLTTGVDLLNQRLFEGESDRRILDADTIPTTVSELNKEVNRDRIIMTLQEWFLMLAKIQEDGAELYKKFSDFSSSKLESVVLRFAQEEFKHKRLMIDLSSDYQFNGIQLNETVAMLSQLQAEYVANNGTDIDISSEKEFLQFALQLEKNYVEIYKRQLDVFKVDSNEYKKFENVIEEARKHMIFIVNILND